MPRLPARQRSRITTYNRQLQTLRNRAERDRRVLTALYNISLACRGSTSFQHIFEATYREMRAIFALDACYIAVCDLDRPDTFRGVLLVDEGVAEYSERVEIGALTGMVLRERRPVLFQDLVAERARVGPPPDTFGNQQRLSRAWLGVPLLVGANAVGVISLQSYQPDVYTTTDVELLQRLGNVVAVALDNAWLDQQQRALSGALAAQVAARTVELVTLSTLAAELVLQRPLPELLERALELIVPVFGLDAGTVRLLDERHEQLSLVAQRGFTPAYAERAGNIPVAGSTTGLITRENRPLMIEANLREQALPALAPYLPYAALLGVPLRIGARVLGALSLFGRDARAFSAQEVDLAQALGNQIAIAIEHARLFAAQERQIRELRALGSISHAASTTLDLPTLLRLVHDELQQFMSLDAFSMMVYDPERRIVTNGLSIDEGRAYTDWDSQPLPEDTLTAWIIRNRRPLHFNNLPAEIGQHSEIRQHQIGAARTAISWLGVPLISRDDAVIGSIFLQGYRANAFDARDAAFLVSVASQVALHVQNARLLAQRERQIRELDAAGQIGQLMSASFDLDEMLNGVYQTLHEVLPASVFYLLICESETRVVTHAIFIEEEQRVPLDWLGRPPVSGSLTAWVMQQREPLLFHDLAQQRGEVLARGIVPQPLGPDNPVRAWVGVPLLAREGEPIGVLSLQDYQSHRYDAQTIDFLRQVASHISLGVQKVRLFAAEQSARRTADTLREVARVLSTSFDPREVLELILRELNNVIAYDTASIMLVERGGLHISAARGFTELGLHAVQDATQHRSADLVVRTRQPMVIADVADVRDWHSDAGSAHIRAWLGVPLIAKGRVLGVLNIDSRQPNAFSARDVEAAQAFASQAAVALENARLYEESVTRVEQELEIARRIQSNLFPRALPHLAGLELAARCLPARETGGDFFDFVELPALHEADSAPTLALIIGDASGKSIPGAMLMAIARSVVRSEANDHRTPQAVMRESNRWIAHDVPPRSFVALCYATLDVAARRLTLANAGQLTPLRRRADGQLDYLEVPGPRLPLGITANTPYEALDMQLGAGDLVVLFTDGIVEAKNDARALFGFERLEALLATHGDDAPEAVIARILAAVDAFAGSTPQHDDMTVVALRVA